MNMEQLLCVLQRSTDNEERKQCQQALRRLQEQSPGSFLSYIMPRVLVADPTMEVSAFFSATVLLDFVKEFWRTVPETMQSSVLDSLLHFLTTQPLLAPRKPLGMKLCTLLGLVTKMQLPRKAQKNTATGVPEVPAILGHVLSQLMQAIQGQDVVRVQALLALHLTLKELLSKRIGKVFDLACAYVAPYLSQWLSVPANPQGWETFVLCLKAAVRVYGHGHFDPAALRHVLSTAFYLAEQVARRPSETALDNDSALTVRSLEYCCKILVVASENFSPRLSDLGLEFFSPSPNGNAPSASLLQFTCLAIQACWDARAHSGAEFFTDKLACRSMKIVIQLTAKEDGDSFVLSVLQHFSQTQTCYALMHLIVEQYLADDAEKTHARWEDDPEGFVSELDVVDDETSPSSCAEQLFLALTGSTACAAQCVPYAWTIVNQLLQQNTAASVTAGLHAIGLGYSTLAGNDATQYLQFLHTKLLPLMVAPDAMRAVSPLILRRVVWVVGMWCESVQEGHERQTIHAALAQLLYPSTDPALLLTALRTVEHFISDYRFAVTDLDCLGSALDTTCNVVLPVYVSQLLACLRHVIPRLRTAPMIKEVVGLCLAMTEKRALTESGETMIYVLQPAVQHSIAIADQLEAHGTAGDASGACDDVGSAELGTFGFILETLASVMKLTTSDAAIWGHLDVVVRCTDPSKVVSTWTQDEAWELLRQMIHSTRNSSDASANVRTQATEALAWCVRHMERDFDGLSTVVRCVTALVVLLHPLPQEQSSYLVERVAASIFSLEGAVFQAYAALSCVLVMACPAMSVPRLLMPILRYHHSVEDAKVQEDERLPSLAVVLAHMVLQQAIPMEQLLTSEDRMLLCMPAQGSSQTLVEKWSLTLDVTGNLYASQRITDAACDLARRGFVASDEDLAMITAAAQSAAESGWKAEPSPTGFSPTSGCPSYHQPSAEELPREGSMDSVRADAGLDDADVAEAREPIELLLEWLGEGGVCCDDVPHAQRIGLLFGVPMPGPRR